MKLLVFCRKALLFALPCGHTKNNLLGSYPAYCFSKERLNISRDPKDKTLNHSWNSTNIEHCSLKAKRSESLRALRATSIPGLTARDATVVSDGGHQNTTEM